MDAFVAALDRGDLAAVDDLFAREGEGWVWYFANDRAGQRLGEAAARRDTLRAYFADRIHRHETFRLLRFAEGGDGNFTFLLRRRADDLRAVERVGKGWVSCSTGKLGVWGIGGAPAPPTFGPCPRVCCQWRGRTSRPRRRPYSASSAVSTASSPRHWTSRARV